jgi:hypothetical protein
MIRAVHTYNVCFDVVHRIEIFLPSRFSSSHRKLFLGVLRFRQVRVIFMTRRINSNIVRTKNLYTFFFTRKRDRPLLLSGVNLNGQNNEINSVDFYTNSSVDLTVILSFLRLNFVRFVGRVIGRIKISLFK